MIIHITAHHTTACDVHVQTCDYPHPPFPHKTKKNIMYFWQQIQPTPHLICELASRRTLNISWPLACNSRCSSSMLLLTWFISSSSSLIWSCLSSICCFNSSIWFWCSDSCKNSGSILYLLTAKCIYKATMSELWNNISQLLLHVYRLWLVQGSLA